MGDVSDFIRIGSGMFTYSPAGFENLYSGVNNENYLHDLGNEILVRELIDSDLNISPNSVHIERDMTWLNQEFKSHNWVDISGEFNSGLLDASGFVFRNMIDESGYYRYNPSINNSGEYISVVKSPEGGEHGSFVYKEEISPPSQRFMFSDKNFLKDMNDIYYDVSRRVNSKFNDLDELEEEIILDINQEFKYYTSGVAIPAIDRSSKEGKPYLDTQSEDRDSGLLKDNPNIDKTQGYGRFFLPRTKLQNFEFIPINYAGNANNSRLFRHSLEEVGNKRFGGIRDIGIFTTVNVASETIGTNATSVNGGLLGSKVLGGHWPGLNIVPNQELTYALDTSNNSITDFKEEMKNQTLDVYQTCLSNYYLDIENSYRLNFTGNQQGGLYPNPKVDTATSSFFQNNIFTLHHNYGLELLSKDGRVDDLYYADITFNHYTNSSLYNYIPCYATYVGTGTLRNKFGLNSKQLKSILEDYVDELNNEKGEFLKDEGEVKIVVGRCLSKREIEYHSLSIQLESSPDGDVITVPIDEIVDAEIEDGFVGGNYLPVREIILQNSIRENIKRKDFTEVGVFQRSVSGLFELSIDFDSINDFNENGEILFIAILVNDGEPLIPSDISSHFETNHNNQAKGYGDSINSLVEKTNWTNHDMLNLVTISPGGWDAARSRVKTGPSYRPSIPWLFPHGQSGGLGFGHPTSFSKDPDVGSPKVVYNSYTVLDDEAVNLWFWISRTEYSMYPLGIYGTEGISILFEGSSERRGVINMDVGGVGGISSYSQIVSSLNPFYDRGIDGSFTAPISVSEVENVTMETGDVSATSIVVYGVGGINDYGLTPDEMFFGNIDNTSLFRYTDDAQLKNVTFPLDNFDLSLRKNHPEGNHSASTYLENSIEKEVEDGLYQYIGTTGSSLGFIQVDGEIEGGVGGLDSWEQAVFDSKKVVTVPGFDGPIQVNIYSNPVPYCDMTASCVSWKKNAQWYFDRIQIEDIGYGIATTDRLGSSPRPDMEDFNGLFKFRDGGSNTKLSDGYILGYDTDFGGRVADYGMISSVTSTMSTQSIGSYTQNPILYNRKILDIEHFTGQSLEIPGRYWSAEGFYYHSWFKDDGGNNYIIYDKHNAGDLLDDPVTNPPGDVQPGFGFLELKNPPCGDYDNNFKPPF